mmetsp:Transcript_19520/g.41181  ORF Transcript_19520/g.41181 Transcript_19520/m.41181 type:complete len:82 (+) Transcript_19520:1397-1642(+)
MDLQHSSSHNSTIMVSNSHMPSLDLTTSKKVFAPFASWGFEFFSTIGLPKSHVIFLGPSHYHTLSLCKELIPDILGYPMAH